MDGYKHIIEKGREARAVDARETYNLKKAQREAAAAKATKLRIDTEEAYRVTAQKSRLNVEDDKIRLLKDMETHMQEVIRGEIISEIREDVYERQERIASAYKRDIMNETKVQLTEDLEPVVTAELRAELTPPIKLLLTDELRPKVEHDLREQIQNVIYEKLVEELRTQIRAELRPDLIVEVRHELRRELTPIVRKELQDGGHLYNIAPASSEVEDDLSPAHVAPESSKVEEHSLLNTLVPESSKTEDNLHTNNIAPKSNKVNDNLHLNCVAPESNPVEANWLLYTFEPESSQVEEGLSVSGVPAESNNVEDNASLYPDLSNLDQSSYDANATPDGQNNQSEDRKSNEVFETVPEQTVTDSVDNCLSDQHIPANRSHDGSSPCRLKRSLSDLGDENAANDPHLDKKIKTSCYVDLTEEEDSAPVIGNLDSKETYGSYEDQDQSETEDYEEEGAGYYGSGLNYGSTTEIHHNDGEDRQYQDRYLENDFVKQNIEGFLGNNGLDYERYADSQSEEYSDDDGSADSESREPLGAHTNVAQVNSAPQLFSRGTKRSLSIEDEEEDDVDAGNYKRLREDTYTDPEDDLQYPAYGSINEGHEYSETEEEDSVEDDDSAEEYSEDEYSSEGQDGQLLYQTPYHGGYAAQAIIKETNTQETAFTIDDSDDEDDTLVEKAEFLPVKKPDIFDDNEDELFYPS